jgi:sigma-B regulation protein RsbU (phosphoserine phosphatase)
MSEPTDPLAAAQAEVVRLRTLVEASKLINSSIEGEALYESILTVARRELDVERGTLFFVDASRREIWARVTDGDANATTEIRLPIGQGLAGSVAATGESVILLDAYADPRFDPGADRRTGFRTRSILCVPIRSRGGAIVGVLQLLNKRSGRFGASDLEFLSALSEHMAIAIQNALAHLDRVARERMERELQLGREIQTRLLPSLPEGVPATRIVATSVACFEVGGDSYDFVPLAGGQLGIAIGDVSGKGVAAALVMSSLQAAVRVAAPAEPDLGRLVARLNALIYGMTGGRKYVTFFFARYDPGSGALHYVNAGHNPPVVIENGCPRLLAPTGRPIGLLPGGAYGEATTRLHPGATLFLYTDGFTEAMSPAEEEYGSEHWLELLASLGDRPIEQIPGEVLDAVARFEAGATASDDKTLVVVRRE